MATILAQSRWDEIGLVLSFLLSTREKQFSRGLSLELDASVQFSIDREMMAHLAESLMGVTVSLHVLVIGDE